LGGTVYSEEELVAEMGAAFLATEADIVRDEHELSAAYLKGWIDEVGKKTIGGRSSTPPINGRKRPTSSSIACARAIANPDIS
jgi:hypothetical protein